MDILTSFGANPNTVNALGHSPRLLAGGAGVGSGALAVIDRLLSDASQEDAAWNGEQELQARRSCIYRSCIYIYIL